MMYQLQQFFTLHRERSFAIIPLYSHGLMHIPIDTTALFDIVARKDRSNTEANNTRLGKIEWIRAWLYKLDKSTKGMNVNQLRLWCCKIENKIKFWRIFYNVDRAQYCGHDFVGSIQTDGVAVSLARTRTDKTKPTKKSAAEQLNEGKFKKNNNMIEEKLKLKKYVKDVCIDPGIKLPMAGTVTMVDDFIRSHAERPVDQEIEIK